MSCESPKSFKQESDMSHLLIRVLVLAGRQESEGRLKSIKTGNREATEETFALAQARYDMEMNQGRHHRD